MKKFICIISILIVQISSQAQVLFNLDTFKVAMFKAIDTAKGNLKKLDDGKVNYIGYFDSYSYSFENNYKNPDNSFLSIKFYKSEEVSNLEPVFDEYARLHKLVKTVEIKKPTKEERKIYSYKKETGTFYKDSLSNTIIEFHVWDDSPKDRYVILRSHHKSNPIASTSSSNSNNDFTTTTVNGIAVATGKLERTDAKTPPKVKLPSGCATKDMRERFRYVNDNDTRWGNYKKGVVIAAYNTALAPKLPHVFNVNLGKNTTYNIGVIFSTKDRKGVLSANASYEISVRSSIPSGYSWSNTYNNTGYIIVGNEDIVMTVSVTGSKYYDLRDTENPEPVCSIVYVDKLFD
jgi:hypothetical protein